MRKSEQINTEDIRLTIHDEGDMVVVQRYADCPDTEFPNTPHKFVSGVQEDLHTIAIGAKEVTQTIATMVKNIDILKYLEAGGTAIDNSASEVLSLATDTTNQATTAFLSMFSAWTDDNEEFVAVTTDIPVDEQAIEARKAALPLCNEV